MKPGPGKDDRKKHARPERILQDKKQYEAFVVALYFQHRKPDDTDETEDHRQWLEAHRLNTSWEGLEHRREKIIDFLIKKYGVLFNKVKEAAWLQRLRSYSPLELARLIEAADPLYGCYYQSLIVEEAANMEKTFGEIERREEAAYLREYPRLWDGESLFEGESVKEIREVIGEVARTYRTKDAAEAAGKLTKLINDAAAILAERPFDSIPELTCMEYFRKTKRQPGNSWANRHHKILTIEYTAAVTSFQNAAWPTLKAKTRNYRLDRDDAGDIRSQAFSRLTGQIRNTAFRPVPPVDTQPDNVKYYWFVKQKLMVNYFLDILVPGELKSFVNQHRPARKPEHTDPEGTLIIPVPDHDIPGKDQPDPESLNPEELSPVEKERIAGIYDRVVQEINQLEDLRHLEETLFTEFFWGNLTIEQELGYQKTRSQKESEILEKEIKSIEEIAQTTINRKTGKPYSFQAGYGAWKSLRQKIAKSRAITIYLVQELKTCLEELESPAVKEVISEFLVRFDRVLEGNVMRYLLEEIQAGMSRGEDPHVVEDLTGSLGFFHLAANEELVGALMAIVRTGLNNHSYKRVARAATRILFKVGISPEEIHLKL